MKRFIYIITVAFLASCGSTQEPVKDEIPAAAKDKLVNTYPGVDSVTWEGEGENYEASFIWDNEETSVVLDALGNILETEITLVPDSLPSAILLYCKDSLEGKVIKEAAKITDDEGKVTFEAEVDGADYIFDAQGTFLKKEVEKDEDKEDKD